MILHVTILFATNEMLSSFVNPSRFINQSYLEYYTNVINKDDKQTIENFMLKHL